MRLSVETNEFVNEVFSWTDLSNSSERSTLALKNTPQAPYIDDLNVLYGSPRSQNQPRNRPSDLVVSRIPGAVCLPRKIIVDPIRSTIPIDSFRHVSLAPPHVDLPDYDEMTDLARAAKHIPGYTYCADIRHRGHGHLLLESLSQIWALKHIRCDQILVSKKASRYFSAIFEPFGIPLVHFKQPIQCENLILARQSYVVGEYISSEFVEICQRIRDYFDPDGHSTRNIYVSRKHADKRRLLGEESVENEFKSRGFDIIYPEKMDLVEQIRTFSRARIVAGPVGSALYNTVFSRPGTRRIILAPDIFYTLNDMLLGAMTCVPPEYIFGRSTANTSAEAMFADWSLDVNDLSRCLSSLYLDKKPKQIFEGVIEII